MAIRTVESRNKEEAGSFGSLTGNEMIRFATILAVLILTFAHLSRSNAVFRSSASMMENIDDIQSVHGIEEVGLLQAEIQTLRADLKKQKAVIDDLRKREERGGANNETVIVDEYDITAYTVPSANGTALALKFAQLFSGFRNQMMAFTILVLQAQKDGHDQLLLPSYNLKDTFGTDLFIPFARLWDIPHWNSHYPALPRFVGYEPRIHDHYNPVSNEYYYDVATRKFLDNCGNVIDSGPTRPYVSDNHFNLFRSYKDYSDGKGKYTDNGHRHPTEILMLRDALRPHPKLQNIIDGLLSSLNSDGEGAVEYVTLHARIEPDMQRHPQCKSKKVRELKEIFRFMEEKWPEPPATHIFMPINREYLEEEGSEEAVERFKAEGKKVNQIAVENLRELNRAVEEGLWGGRVKVFEFGSKALADTEYRDRPSTTGALINFFISIGGKIFIGTEISSYSLDILATRFYRNTTENYKYLPEGLLDWMPPGTEDPPGFYC